MGEKGWAYLGSGDWMELGHSVSPSTGEVEIPLRDVTPMVVEVLKRDLLNLPQAARILKAAEDSLYRQAQL